MIDETLDLLIETVRDEAIGLPSDDLVHDNLRYLRELNALREAAGKVTCKRCGGQGYLIEWPAGFSVTRRACPDCADLRALLSPAPSTPTR